MNLKLKRPLAFFDLETTGTNVATDRIVEIAVLKVYPDGKQEVKTRKLNPTIPIPLEASLIHGIYDEDVKDAPTFKSVAKSLAELFTGCDIAGFNSNKFDVPLLVEEFLRAGIDFNLENVNLVDVQNIFHQMEKRTLAAGYQFYCGKNLENAHSAEADTIATFEILEAMVNRYKNTEIENDKGEKIIPVTPEIEDLSSFSKRDNSLDLAGRIVSNDKSEACFNFGKYKGKSVVEVLESDPSYYAWMMNGDFPLYTKKVLENLKLQMLKNKLNNKL